MERLLCRVVNDSGVPFNVTTGINATSYGKYRAVNFYDDRYHGTKETSPWRLFGQFVAGYTAKTLAEDAVDLSRRGLCLQGGVPDWCVTGENMTEVFLALLAVLLEGESL